MSVTSSQPNLGILVTRVRMLSRTPPCTKFYLSASLLLSAIAMTYFWICDCSFISCKYGSGVLFYDTCSFIDSFIQWFINSFSSFYVTVLRNTTKNSWSVYLLSNHEWRYTLHSSTGPISSFRYTLVQVTLVTSAFSIQRDENEKYFRASPAAVTGQWPG